MAKSSEAGRPRLGRSYFDRSTVAVARDLVGADIEVRAGARGRRARLVEVEAYTARDPASHAYRGPTRRNRSMFGPPGTLYVFRIHQVVCANLVTRPGQAVLLRAGAPLDGAHGNPSGPGRLCRYLGLSIDDDGVDATRGERVRLTAAPFGGTSVLRSPRVGISRATERRLRFTARGDPWVSRPRPVG